MLLGHVGKEVEHILEEDEGHIQVVPETYKARSLIGGVIFLARLLRCWAARKRYQPSAL
jgi:hypothetical protein